MLCSQGGKQEEAEEREKESSVVVCEHGRKEDAGLTAVRRACKRVCKKQSDAWRGERVALTESTE